MSAFQAQFDCSAGDSYAQKQIAASTAFTVEVDVVISAAVLALLVVWGGGAYNWFATLVGAIGGTGGDGIEPLYVGPGFDWLPFVNFAPDGGVVNPDVVNTLRWEVAFNSGTTWDAVTKANGVTVYSYTNDLGANASADLLLQVGGSFANAIPGQIYLIRRVEVRDASDTVVFSDDFSDGTFDAWDSVTGTASIVSSGSSSDIGIRTAFGYATYDPAAQFVRLDDPTVPGLTFDGAAHNINGYQIDRGRTYELDKTQAGTAGLTLLDVSGIFDPTNPASPLYGQIGPMQQTKIGVQHPWTGAYFDLFTGFLESWGWVVTSDQALMTITVGLVDGFEPLTRAEIPPGANGTTIFAYASDVQIRLDALLDVAGWPTAPGWRNINTGNVYVQRTVYNPQTSVLSAMQDAADADFPGVANVFMRKGGAVAFLGRYPRFKPDLFPQDVAFWTCGDANAVGAFGGATIKNIEWELDNKNLINAALALPFGIAQTDIAGQLVYDAASIAQFGVRTKSLPDLLVGGGPSTLPNDGQPASTFQPALPKNAVCLAYAQYYVSNYAQPVIRISTLEFEVVLGTKDTPSATWDLVLGVEIGDILTVNTTNPGGGGFGKGTGGTESPTPAQFFVEGIHYTAAFVDDVPILKLSLDVSPRTWFAVEPWTV